jgi:hypothetical protein
MEVKMSKQTPVDWLVNVVQSCIAPNYIPKEIIEQALQMEREQMEKAVSNGISKTDMIDNRGYFNFDKGYNETYGVKGRENKTFMSEEEWVKEYTGEKGRDIGGSEHGDYR